MPGQDLTNFDAALKEWYGPRMNSTINENRVLLKRLQRGDSTMISGRRVVIPVNIRGSQSLGAKPAAGPTPSPQRQTIVEMRVTMNYLYGTVQFDLPTILASRNDAGAFARVMDAEMKGIRRDAQNDLNRQLFGNSLGSLGTVNGAAAALTTAITVDSGHKIKAGMIIDTYTNSSGDPSTTRVWHSVEVASVTSTTITLSTAITASDNDHFVREDARGYEVMGLDAIQPATTSDTSTVFNISRSTYPEWAAQAVNAASAPLDADLMQQAFMKAEEEGEGEISLIITDYTQWRKYGSSLIGDRRFPAALKLDGGLTALDFNGKPVVPDRDSKPQRMNFMDEDTYTIYEMTNGWQWDDTSGNILQKLSRQPAYEGLLYNFLELACDDPANNCTLYNLAA